MGDPHIAPVLALDLRCGNRGIDWRRDLGFAMSSMLYNDRARRVVPERIAMHRNIEKQLKERAVTSRGSALALSHGAVWVDALQSITMRIAMRYLRHSIALTLFTE